MKFSINWLKQYIDLALTVKELSDKLTYSGIEVEGIESSPLAKRLSSVVTARIIECKSHPAKDELLVCTVDDGTDTRQVVCGAPNCRPGLKTAYIPCDSYLGDMLVKRIEIKGVVSEGMLCSEKELGLSDNHEGIIELSDNVGTGKSIVDLFSLDDTTFDVEITPNRPDLLAITGIARELGAILNKKFDLRKAEKLESYSGLSPQASDLIENKEPQRCSRYLGIVINDIVVGESPVWLKKRLATVGIKPVNNVVDISNFVMMEYGHPLHAFDYDKLSGNKIIVRNAENGEKIAALDNKTHTLAADDLVIADAEKPVAVAGVIGGVETSISGETKNILLETANFDFASVRKTSRRNKIFTDSSYRFERNLSDGTVPIAAAKAVEMIIELCSSKERTPCPVSCQDSYPDPKKQPDVDIRVSRTNRLLATDLTKKQVIDYLERLQLKTVKSSEDTITLAIPYFRKDLTREVDLIEEVIRLYGYNKVGERSEVVTRSLTDKNRFKLRRKIADFLYYNGFSEAVNSSFADKSFTDMLELPEEDYRSALIEIENPIGADSSVMRTSLLPGLLNNAMLNISSGRESIKLFEISKIYFRQEDRPVEKLFLTGIVTGNENPEHWQIKPRKADIFSVKGTIESLLDTIKCDIDFVPAQNSSYLQKGQELSIITADKKIGEIGKIDPFIAKKFDLQQPLYIFDVDLEMIIGSYQKRELTYSEIVRFPEVERDISFIANKKISHKSLLRVIKNVDTKMIKRVRLIDEFQGKNIPEECRSLTYRLNLSSAKGTLTDNSIQQLINNIFDRLSDEYDIEKR